VTTPSRSARTATVVPAGREVRRLNVGVAVLRGEYLAEGLFGLPRVQNLGGVGVDADGLEQQVGEANRLHPQVVRRPPPASVARTLAGFEHGADAAARPVRPRS
jgi:hypothetical protein